MKSFAPNACDLLRVSFSRIPALKLLMQGLRMPNAIALHRQSLRPCYFCYLAEHMFRYLWRYLPSGLRPFDLFRQ